MADESVAADPTAVGLLSQKDYARRRGWSKQYVNQLVKQGRISLVDGRIDPVAADTALAGMHDPSRGPQFRGDPNGRAAAGPSPFPGIDSTPGMQGTFVKARTVREHFRALKEKMEYEAAAGELVSRKEIEDASHEIGVVFREHMTRAAEPIAGMIANRLKVDYGAAFELITIGINQALERLANSIRDNEWGFDKGLPSQGHDHKTGIR